MPNWWCGKSPVKFSSMQMDNGVGFIQRRTYNKMWNKEIWIHRCGVCQKNSDDKVRWNSIEISQWNSTLGVFLGLEIVYLLVLFLPGFIAILSLMSNRSLHSFSFVMINMLQIIALICITSSFSLLHLLLFGINVCHRCVTYLRFVHYD